MPTGRTTLFAASLASQLAAKGTLSVAQADAIVRSLERQAERAWELEAAAESAAAVGAPEGTVAVEGEILIVRVEPSRFHYGSEVRMLIRASTPDGGLYRVWATKPVGLSKAAPRRPGPLRRRAHPLRERRDLRLRQAAPEGLHAHSGPRLDRKLHHWPGRRRHRSSESPGARGLSSERPPGL